MDCDLWQFTFYLNVVGYKGGRDQPLRNASLCFI